MELPFAVESPEQVNVSVASLQHSTAGSSLVTASSQGSLMNSSGGMSSPLPPNTPQDVVLPHYDNYHGQGTPRQQGIPGHLVSPAPLMQVQEAMGELEIIDFTYVNVCETDEDEADIVIEGGEALEQQDAQRGDVLTVLLSGVQQEQNEALVTQTEEANLAATKASEAKKRGDLQVSLELHKQAAQLYRDIAMAVRERNSSLANSLLLLSQTQAKSALALKRIVKLSPVDLQQVFPASSERGTSGVTASMSHKERLRAAVRGALGSRHPREEDISDSTFLGRAVPGSSPNNSSTDNYDSGKHEDDGTLLAASQDSNHNPVDEMMELERELRDMDMALELGNSISSLDARMHNRMKNSMVDGSFMVVPPGPPGPPGSNSYMSSSMWGSGHIPSNPRPPQAPPPNTGTAGVRARANRVQNMLEASATPGHRPPHHPPNAAHALPKNPDGLESSWWGASSASQVLASSVISLGSRGGGPMGEAHGEQPTNTKQLMRLMDSLKTLGDENAALLREVEDAEAARIEAKAAREQMKRFKVDYGKRFATLKKALEKFRKEHPDNNGGGSNPVNKSEFIRSASVTEQLQRQEQLIRKLTADLKKEKEESKKKDAALRKYESFYREVKARSAQKAAQRQMETQQRQQKARYSGSARVPR